MKTFCKTLTDFCCQVKQAGPIFMTCYLTPFLSKHTLAKYYPLFQLRECEGGEMKEVFSSHFDLDS